MPGRPQISAQVSGQATGEMEGQLSGLAQQNGSSLASQASNHGGIQRSWHSDIDVHGVRRHIVEKILQGFQQYAIAPEWQRRLPNLVKLLEEDLFNEAASKEEYMDLNTLQQRSLYVMVHRFQLAINRNQSLGSSVDQ